MRTNELGRYKVRVTRRGRTVEHGPLSYSEAFSLATKSKVGAKVVTITRESDAEFHPGSNGYLLHTIIK